MKFDLRNRAKYPIIFVVGCIVVLVLPFFVPFRSATDHVTTTVTLLTALGGATGFFYSKHAQETRLFRELFREFNARYDTLNDRLNEIRTRAAPKSLEATDQRVLCDYFNLCAEEHMYAAAGCIDSRVWRAWQNGMRYFAQDPEILDFWKRELQQDSYYGFTLDFNGNA